MLTANRGWVTHGELVPGDYVYSDKGLPVRVLAVTEQYNPSVCYRVTFKDGSSIVAGAGHLWRVRKKIRRRVPDSEKRTIEWSEDFVTTDQLLKLKHPIDIGSPPVLKLREKELPVDPYVLGAWLGDGTSSSARITCAYKDIELIENIRNRGISADERKSSNESSGYYQLGPNGNRAFGFSYELRKLGVLNNKHIPEIYLFSSEKQRIDLLRGLMDTDGCCSLKGQATFSNTNKQLALDVYQLASGLGMQPKIREYTAKLNGKEISPAWEVNFQAHTDRNPFLLNRKASRAIRPSHYRGSYYVSGVELVKGEPTRCIQVDGGMYCAGRQLAPTHNSTIITYGFQIQQILASHGDDPILPEEVTIGIFSHTRPSAKSFLRQIKHELEANETLKDLFPDVLYDNPERDAPTWSEDSGIIVRRKTNPKEATVEAWGLVDGQPTGKHFNRLVYDDVVTLKSVSSPEMIQKTNDAWALSLNLGTDTGQVQYIGTRYHFNDTYRVIMERDAAKPRIYPGTDNGKLDGNPVLFSRELWADRVRKMGTYIASAQLLQNPVADESQGARREWLRFYQPPNTGDGMNKIILVDPAGEKKGKSHDFSSFVVIGLGPDGNMYILDFYRDKLNLKQRTDLLFLLHRKWRPYFVGYERYGKDSDISHINGEMGHRNYHFDIAELGGNVSKNDRIRRMFPDLEANKWYFPAVMYKTIYDGKTIDVIEELLINEYDPFPVPVHDDGLDCISRFYEDNVPKEWPMQYESKPADRYAKLAKSGRSFMSG